MSASTLRLPHDVLRTRSVVIYRPNGLVNASQVFKATEKNFVPTSMSAPDLELVESTPTVSIFLATLRAYVEKALKVIHMMDAPTSTNARILKLVERVQFVQTLRGVIAATALKVLMEMPDQQDVLITTNVHVPLVDEMRNARMRSAHSGATVQKDL